MKKAISYFSAVILIFGIAFTLPTELSAKLKAPKNAKKPEPVVHDTVSMISDSSITVAGKKDSKTYAISKFTTIIVNGQAATTSAISVGMAVMVGADSGGNASMINAHNATEPAKTGKKK